MTNNIPTELNNMAEQLKQMAPHVADVQGTALLMVVQVLQEIRDCLIEFKEMVKTTSPQ